MGGGKFCLFRKKNYQTFMQNDDVNGTYLFMFYPSTIYFMMTLASIILDNVGNNLTMFWSKENNLTMSHRRD